MERVNYNGDTKNYTAYVFHKNWDAITKEIGFLLIGFILCLCLCCLYFRGMKLKSPATTALSSLCFVLRYSTKVAIFIGGSSM